MSRYQGFSEYEIRTKQKVFEFIQRSGGTNVSRVRSFCRSVNLTGMAETILQWLEQDGLVEVDWNTHGVYLKETKK